MTKTLKVPGFAWARTAGQPRYIDYEVRSVDKKVNVSLSRKIDYSDLSFAVNTI